jgi:hypothetical protein
MMTMRHWITSFLNEAGDSADRDKLQRVGLTANDNLLMATGLTQHVALRRHLAVCRYGYGEMNP